MTLKGRNRGAESGQLLLEAHSAPMLLLAYHFVRFDRPLESAY